ncbi:AAA family ATPase [Clostridium sp.]|uniref:ATP-dependent nuclease n=1 Tax=Clostridium sp. TaxID=1506 RepID=UPI002FC8E892
MVIEWIKIKGFRNFEDEVINFSDKTLIIGSNDVGKTNMLYALRLLFDKRLSDKDLELCNSDYNAYNRSTEIEITVRIKNICEDCLRSIFGADIKDDAVIIKYTNSKNGEYSIWAGPSEDLIEEKTGRFYLKRLNLEYVDTNRDLISFIKKERTKLLEASKKQLPDDLINQDKEAIDGIQGDLNDLNKSIDNLHYIKTSLDSVNQELGKLSIHNEGQVVKFVTNNGDVGELLNNVELSYVTDEEVLTIGGDGRSNQIFLAMWVAKQKKLKNLECVTLFAIEEPEAHLHPHQQRKLSKYLVENFEEQIFITTHSPQIASEFRPNNIARLFSINKITKAAQGGCSKDIALTFNEFGYRLNAISSEVFFSNVVFLVEGPSEKIFYTALASRIGIDFDRLNATILSVDGVGFKPYIKICKALDIPFVMRTDNDIFPKTKKGDKYHYFAGISRAMGIYDELISKGGSDELTIYWKENKDGNEWQGDISECPYETQILISEIKAKLDAFNIFLSVSDLERDIVLTPLAPSLKAFYNETNDENLINLMQERKAENMLKYVSEKIDDLTCLSGEYIAAPLHRIVKLVEGVVH